MGQLSNAPPGGGRRRWASLAPLAVLLTARLALGLTYSQVVPPWESYDEDGHFAYARYLAVHRTLLLTPGDPEAEKIWERFQPPLYYNLIAPVIGAFDLGETFDGPARNPHFTAGDAGVNYALHTPAASAAERQLMLAVRAARAVSVIISTLSVIAVWVTARRVWPGERRTVLAATALYAFWPQFLFVGSMVTNDTLVTALAAAALVPAAGLVRHGFRLRRALSLGAVMGAALLAKINAASLVPLAGAAVALSLLPAGGRTRRWRPWQVVTMVGALALGVAGAVWALSSLEFVTGQVFQLATVREFVRNVGPGGGSAWSLVTAALPYAFRTFVASFGWGNLETFAWVYWLWTAGSALAVAGLVIGVIRRRIDRPRGSLYALMAIFIFSLLGLTLALAVAHQSVYLVPGRYLLPTLPAVVILLVGGWRELLRGASGRWAAKAVAAGTPLLGWAMAVGTFLPAYAPPPNMTPATARVETPQAVFFDQRIELIGSSGPGPTMAGEALDVTLCWQAVAPVPEDYSLFLEVVGADQQGYGRLTTYPGRGNYPTSAWPVNAPFCEIYRIGLGGSIPAPALAQLEVSWIGDETGERLPATTFGGAPLEGNVARMAFKVAAQPGEEPVVANEVNFGFGGSGQYPNLRLTGYTVGQEGQEVVITLRWQALTEIPGDYSVFVHLRDTPETYFALGDSQPRSGAYPTWLWQPGEIVLDTHRLALSDLPTPPLALYVGLHNPAEDARVAAYDAEWNRLEHDEVLLATGLEFR